MLLFDIDTIQINFHHALQRRVWLIGTSISFFSFTQLSERNKHEFPAVLSITTPTFLHCYFGTHFYSLTFLDISIVLNDIILTVVSGFSFYDHLNWNHFVHRFNEFMWNSIKICNKSCCPFSAKMKYNFRNKIRYVSCFF